MTEGEPPSDEQLARSLDELALAYHDCPQGTPAEAEREISDFVPQYPEVGARFPDFGYYASADPAIVLDEKPTVGDAIDDLIDIVGELREVSWRFEKAAVELRLPAAGDRCESFTAFAPLTRHRGLLRSEHAPDTSIYRSAWRSSCPRSRSGGLCER